MKMKWQYRCHRQILLNRTHIKRRIRDTCRISVRLCFNLIFFSVKWYEISLAKLNEKKKKNIMKRGMWAQQTNKKEWKENIELSWVRQQSSSYHLTLHCSFTCCEWDCSKIDYLYHNSLHAISCWFTVENILGNH